MANGKWVRISANMNLGAYDVFEATGKLPDPEWPEKSFAELLQIGFGKKYIDNLDHQVLLNLRGES